MAVNLERAARREPKTVGVRDANFYIATTYFKQATELLKKGLYAEAETYLREVLRIWPDHAGALNNMGTAVWRQGRIDEAEDYYRRGLALRPDDFGILNNLGNALWEQGRPILAAQTYRQALAIQPDSAETQMNLGVALSDLGELDEALGWIRAALRRNPDCPEALDNLGLTLARQGKWDEALRWHEQALRVRPEYPEARRNRAYAWLARGDYARGWPEHEWRARCRNHKAPDLNLPQWRGGPLGGRAIMLHAEQGIGDTLQFLRFAIEVKRRGAGRVVVACPDPLIEIVARCPAVDHVQGGVLPLWDCQVHSPLMSLPAALGVTLENLVHEVPYLSAEPGGVARWRPAVARCVAELVDREAGREAQPRLEIKVGIAWQGNPLNRTDRWRSIPLGHFRHLAEVPGVRLISLQKGSGTEQLAEVAGQFPVAVLRDPDGGDEDRRTLLDTAAVMRHLDLVVAPDSAIAHLAGSLGVKVWVGLPSVPEWRWLINRDKSPWYPTMALFRQSTAGDWDGVFRRMAGVLNRRS